MSANPLFDALVDLKSSLGRLLTTSEVVNFTVFFDLAAETIGLEVIRAGCDGVLTRMKDAERRGVAAVVCDGTADADEVLRKPIAAHQEIADKAAANPAEQRGKT
jgi:hypothetical protein